RHRPARSRASDGSARGWPPRPPRTGPSRRSGSHAAEWLTSRPTRYRWAHALWNSGNKLPDAVDEAFRPDESGVEALPVVAVGLIDGVIFELEPLDTLSIRRLRV